MSEEDLVLLLGRAFRPLGGRLPKDVLRYVEKGLRQAQMPFHPADWAGYSFGLSFGAFLLFVPLFWALFLVAGSGAPALYSVSSAFAFSALVLFLVFLEPVRAKRAFAKEFEADMPLGLQVLAMELNSGTRFREALVQASAGNGRFSVALGKLLAEERAGGGMGACLGRLASSVDSVFVRRACSILKNEYRLSRGRGLGDPLLALSEEMLRNNENELRVYSAKSGLFSQGATVLTIVAPTMIVSLVVVASIFTKISWPPAVFTLAIGFGITLVAALLYRIQLMSLPVFVRRMGAGGLSGLERKLLMLGYGSVGDYAGRVALLAVPAFLVFAAVAWRLPPVQGFLALLFSVLSVLSVAFLYPHVQFGRLQRELEDGLPLALEQAAQFAHGERVEDVMGMIADLGLGRLSSEFGKAGREMRGGARFEDALGKVCRDSGSLLLERASSFLVRAHKTGVDVSAAMRETAAYLRRMAFIVQEGKSATFAERVTQVFGFFMSAGLFAVVVSMGKSLGALLAGTDFAADHAMLGAVVSGIRINLLLQPFVIAWNLSELEGDRKKFFFYLPLLLAGGNAVFIALSGVPFV